MNKGSQVKVKGTKFALIDANTQVQVKKDINPKIPTSLADKIAARKVVRCSRCVAKKQGTKVTSLMKKNIINAKAQLQGKK